MITFFVCLALLIVGFLTYSKVQQYLAILVSWIMPPDSPYLTSIWSEGVIKWTSMSAYLPLCSLAGVVAYWKAKRGDSKKRIVGTCAVFALVPILNSAFYALNSSYYARWYYMPVLVLAAMTVNALEDHNTDLDSPARGISWLMIATVAFAVVPVQDSDTGSWSFGVLKNPGQYCAVLGFGLLGLLLGSRRRLSAGVSMAVLAFYMLVVGLSPSVVRACIMQAFVLAAPLFKRDSDGLTSLGAALLVILLANPFAAGSISLQLSFAATLGLVWLSPKLYRNLSRFYTGTSRAVRWAVNFLCANVSASVSALVFTIPLTAIYFNILTLTAPISNLLAVPAAGWNFMAGFVTVLAGFVWLPAARVLGLVCFGLVRYVLWVAGVLASAPGHAVYFSNGFLKYWLLYVYAMFGGCLLTRDRRRKYAVAGVLAAVTLALAVGLNTGLHQYGDLSVMALDVGQGESVALYTREKAVLVDCGSSNSYISAGARAADQLESIGIHRLSAVAVTHYHADHTNGLEELLARMPVERLLLPEIQDEYGVRDRLLALARELDIPVTMVTDTYQFPMGQAMLTVYPPVGAGDLNEQGLTFLCSAGDFDALITGDMAGNTEKKLVERFDLPDIEVLVVGHHGSRYSSTDAFLQQVRPETAIISVGDNSYGHPTQEAMDRLSRNGAAVYRTDRQGNVLVTVNGGT